MKEGNMEQTEMAAQMEQAVQQFNEMMEKLRLELEPIWEAILEIMRIIVETIKRICESWRRWGLYAKLVHWHIPHRVAKFIANHWPKRWLPAWNL